MHIGENNSFVFLVKFGAQRATYNSEVSAMKMQTIDSAKVFEVRVTNQPGWGVLPNIIAPYTVIDYFGDLARGLLVWFQEFTRKEEQ